MPFDYYSAVQKQYTKQPVSQDFIPTNNASRLQILWVGCSDSLVLETECLEGLREEMFVHRNLGALVSNGDLSTTSAVEWCVDLLKVDHIVVCGHYDCAMVKERVDEKAYHGWYKDASKLHEISDAFLSKQNLDEKSKDVRFEEVFVLAEADWLRRQDTVQKAIKERGLKIHAFVYDKETNSCVRLVEVEDSGEKRNGITNGVANVLPNGITNGI